jgi:uncharacterized protein (DUF697 family)
MSKSEPSKEEKATQAKQGGVVGGLVGQIVGAIDKVDEEAARERVAALREAQPEATPDELVEALIKQKCMQTGAVGAVTSGASVIPGVGTAASLTFGVAADIGMTFKLQAELVLEIAAVYGRELNPTEKRNVVMLVTGISAGAEQLLKNVGTRVAEKATERLARKSVTKAIPVLGVAASAGANVLSTYIIGRRAQAYFSLGPEAMGDWGESVRAITGVDERKFSAWLIETTDRSWKLAGSSAQSAAAVVIVAGKSIGEVIVVGADKVGEAAAGVGKGIARGAGTAAGAVVGVGKKAGEGVVAGAGKAGEAVAGVGKGVVEGTGAAIEQASKIFDVFKRDQAGEKGEEGAEPGEGWQAGGGI